jgi:hypothetical protein
MAKHSTVLDIRAKWRNLLTTYGDMDIHTRMLISLFLDDLIRLEKETLPLKTITVREMRANGEMEQSP